MKLGRIAALLLLVVSIVATACVAPGAPGAPTGVSKVSDAASALVVLGYSNAEITPVLKKIDTDSLPLEEIIRQALKQMIR